MYCSKTYTMLFIRFVYLFIPFANCYRILGVFPSALTSHYKLATKLMSGLAEAGHDVTVISPFKYKTPPINGTYTDIVLDELAEHFKNLLQIYNVQEKRNGNIVYELMLWTNFYVNMSSMTLHHPKVKALLDSKVSFDAVIIETFLNDALKIFAHFYKCPLVLLAPHGAKGWMVSAVGNPRPVSYVPYILLPGDHIRGMTFFQRARNLYYYIAEYLWQQFYHMPVHDRVLHSAFPQAPSLWDLYLNVSIVLMNSHTSVYQAVPTVPNMVEVGGYHIDQPRKLPQDLQNYLDGSTNGVIYFSMGSIISAQIIPRGRLQMFANVFKRLRQNVLWKIDNCSMEFSENVFIRKWVPQQDLLAHPNVKLFITHGGLLSVMEAAYHGVPILSIPIYGDQPVNAQQAVRSGAGLKLDYHDDKNFNEETLLLLIEELINNKKYRENAERVSRLFRDRPVKPIDNAVYWVEYAVRHNGADHLKVAGIYLPWYKYFMVDVALLLLFVVMVFSYIACFIIRALFKVDLKKPIIDEKKVN